VSQAAYVRSSQAIDRFRGAVAQFRGETLQTLDEVRMEVDRFVEWLEHEQTAYWKSEILRWEGKVSEAKVDLHRARAATIDAEHTPSCLQEQKVLENAKRRLAATEDKYRRVRGWIPVVRQAVEDFRTQIAPLVNDLNAELPKAIARLQQLAELVDAYAAVAVPTMNPTAPMNSGAADDVSKAKNGES
jgi:uncharacterized protein YPO0396